MAKPLRGRSSVALSHSAKTIRMRPTTKTRKKAPKAAEQRRAYDSPLRRQQAAETRDSILDAGVEIAHGLPAWDWRGMTFKAVAERAGISERTVHRYYATERALRDAILQRLVQESGVPLQTVDLRNFGGIVTRLYRYLSSFAATPQLANPEARFLALDQQRRDALLAAVAAASQGWSRQEQEMAAAVLDMFWNPVSFERLGTAWELDTDQAAQALAWVAGLVEKAIRDGHRPRVKQ